MSGKTYQLRVDNEGPYEDTILQVAHDMGCNILRVEEVPVSDLTREEKIEVLSKILTGALSTLPDQVINDMYEEREEVGKSVKAGP